MRAILWIYRNKAFIYLFIYLFNFLTQISNATEISDLSVHRICVQLRDLIACNLSTIIDYHEPFEHKLYCQ